jgi:hypothetical protein
MVKHHRIGEKAFKIKIPNLYGAALRRFSALPSVCLKEK